MKPIRFYVFLLGSFLSFNLSAQNLPFPNHMLTPEYLRSNSLWVWANDFGLHFSDINNPVPIYKEVEMGDTVPGTTYAGREGNTAICDPHTGDVLFYKDATVLRNKEDAIMPNGDSLYGDGGSGAQSEIIVPMPGDSNLYIVFSIKDIETPIGDPNRLEDQLFYSMVDMRLDSGRGDVVSGMKNKVVYPFWDSMGTSLTEGIATIPGDSGEIWLIVHGGYNVPPGMGRGTAVDSNYYVFKILPEFDNAGVATGDVEITGPQIYPGRVKQWASRLKVSPNRDWIFHQGAFGTGLTDFDGGLGPITYGGQELAQFNSATGEIFNVIPLNISPHITARNAGVGAADFSPDGKVLHFVTKDGNFKYSLENPDSLAIVNSTQFSSLGSEQFTLLGQPFFPAVKLYGQKIYVVTSASNFVQCIENPNEYIGPTVVNKNLTNLQLTSRLYAFGGDPSFAVYGFKNYSGTDTLWTCENEPFALAPKYTVYDNTSPIWFNGDTTSATMTVDQPGIYWVTYYRGLLNHYYAYQTDTFVVATYPAIVPVIQIDQNNPDLLRVSAIYSQYQWYRNGMPISGATSSEYLVDQNGLYHVEVVDENGCPLSSPEYEVTNRTNIKDINAQGIFIYPNPVKNVLTIKSKQPLRSSVRDMQGRVVINESVREKVDMTGLSSGLYFLVLEDLNQGAFYTQKVIKQ